MSDSCFTTVTHGAQTLRLAWLDETTAEHITAELVRAGHAVQGPMPGGAWLAIGYGPNPVRVERGQFVVIDADGRVGAIDADKARRLLTRR